MACLRYHMLVWFSVFLHIPGFGVLRFRASEIDKSTVSPGAYLQPPLAWDWNPKPKPSTMNPPSRLFSMLLSTAGTQNLGHNKLSNILVGVSGLGF